MVLLYPICYVQLHSWIRPTNLQSAPKVPELSDDAVAEPVPDAAQHEGAPRQPLGVADLKPKQRAQRRPRRVNRQHHHKPGTIILTCSVGLRGLAPQSEGGRTWRGDHAT